MKYPYCLFRKEDRKVYILYIPNSAYFSNGIRKSLFWFSHFSFIYAYILYVTCSRPSYTFIGHYTFTAGHYTFTAGHYTFTAGHYTFTAGHYTFTAGHYTFTAGHYTFTAGHYTFTAGHYTFTAGHYTAKNQLIKSNQLSHIWS